MGIRPRLYWLAGDALAAEVTACLLWRLDAGAARWAAAAAVPVPSSEMTAPLTVTSRQPPNPV